MVNDSPMGAHYERAAELFEQIWPSGTPARERLVFDAVKPDEREKVLDRIEAAWRGERGERWEELATGVGLSRAGFFNLRRNWREHGIAGVVPHGTQRPRRLAETDHPLRESARALLRAKGGKARNVDVARALLEKSGLHRETTEVAHAIALQKAERLVQHERRALGRNPTYLAKAYGYGLLVDLTATSIQLNEDARRQAVVAVVVETASGLILGSAIGSLDHSLALEREAIAEAYSFLADRRADRAQSKNRPLDLHFTLPPYVSEDDLPLDALRRSVRDLSVGRPGGHGYGQALVQLVGPRVGRIVLAPRRTLDVDVDSYRKTRVVQVLDPDRATSSWRREVLRHNEPILEILAAIHILDGHGVGAGGMSQVLGSLDAVLSAV